jgi:DNA-binding response OmpR family regulator
MKRISRTQYFLRRRTVTQELASSPPKTVSIMVGQAKLTGTVRFLHIGSGLQRPNMDILVADDDPTGRFLLNSALMELGHTVTGAADGSDAWQAWRRQRHQLVISDWMMPGIDGLELCRRIRAEEASGFAYIILITARAGKANYLDAMDSGVDDFLHKPFDRDRFIARVRVAMRILDLHQRLRLANTDLERRVEERTAELEKALKAKSEFLSRASHELRTPMNHILGFAQLLSLKKGLTEKQEASVRQILESGRRLLALIDHILGFSKSHANELSFEATGVPRAGNT